MLFTSGIFFLFLAVTFAVYYLLPGVWQLRWIICASLFFYAYDNPPLLLLLLSVAICDVIFSRQVVVSRNPRAWAAIGVIINLTVLAFFKYNRLLIYNRVTLAIFPSLLTVHEGPIHDILLLPLPIGISFYTFHGISLLLDTFRRGEARDDVSSARRLTDHIQNTLLYVSFFPQLIAGPIVKAHKFYPQIKTKSFRDIAWKNAVDALVLGYFLKVVVADNLGQQTFWLTYPYFLSFASINLILMLFGYSAQIFADFAGYSLIAIGLGRLFGYELPTNFFFPYISETFSEFWTRWHISLSSWLREYLYIPLGGNRKGRFRTYANLLIVMTLGGLWHGAASSYAIWGFWHGSALAIERMCRHSRFYASKAATVKFTRGLLVFAVVTGGWLLFKFPRFSDALAFLKALSTNMSMPLDTVNALMTVTYAAPVLLYHLHYLYRRRMEEHGRLTPSETSGRPYVFGMLMAAIVLIPGPPQSFIYFQF